MLMHIMLSTGVLKIRKLEAVSNVCEVAMKENAKQRSILLVKRQTRYERKLAISFKPLKQD